MGKKRAWMFLNLAAVVALTLVSGMLEGRIRNRWGPSETLQAAGQKLEDVPRQFGGGQNDRWQVQSLETIDRDSIEMLECTGYFARTYANRRTGQLVNVFVILGPAGPIAVHTPEICYSSRNYKIHDRRQRVAVPDAEGREDQFWALSFKANRAEGQLLRVYYAWSEGDRWTAPNDARFAFAGSPFLYKIQLSSNLPDGTDLKTGDTCREFLNDFVPVMRRHLFGSAGR